MKNEKCPLCGKKMIQKKGSVRFPTKDGKVTVPDISYSQCTSCREKVFSQEAQKVIEQIVYGKIKRSVA